MLVGSIPRSAVVQQSLTAFVAVLAGVLSFCLTLQFFRQICPREGAYELWAMGTLWESAKILFGGVGLCDLKRTGYKIRAFFFLTLSFVLAVGSVVASFVFVSGADAQGRRQALAASEQYQRAQHRLLDIEAQTKLLMTAAGQDMAQGFRTRSHKTLEQVEDLRRESSHVAAELLDMEATGHVDRSPALGADVQRLGHKTMRTTAHCVLAVMLEVIGIAAMSLLGANRRVTGQFVSETAVAPGAVASPVTPLKTQCIFAGGPEDGTDRYSDARRRVISNELRPSYKALQEAFLISQSTAQRYLRRMRQEGVVQQVGRSYFLPRPVMAGGAG